MIKNIIFGDGTVIPMEFNGDLIKRFENLAKLTFAKARKGLIQDITPDEEQEIYIQLYKSFERYNEKNAFSTLVVWDMKSLASRLKKEKEAQKRDTGDFKFVDLDFKLSNGSGEGEKSIHDVVADNTVDIEREYEDMELIDFLTTKLNPTEVALIPVLLGEKRDTQVVNELGKSKTSISNSKSRLMKKLPVLIEEFNLGKNKEQIAFF